MSGPILRNESLREQTGGDKITYEYYQRCCKFLNKEPSAALKFVTDDEATKQAIFTMDVLRAHRCHNDTLLYAQEDGLPGCVEMGIHCECKSCQDDPSSCRWLYNCYRCECGNYKGFRWNMDNVNWLKDIDLDSTSYVGVQERMW